MLVNMTGKKNRWQEIDLLQEHMDYWIKATRGPYATWKWLAEISPCISALRELATQVNTSLAPRNSNHHTSPNLQADLDALVKSLVESKVHERDCIRHLDKSLQAKDVLALGFQVLEGYNSPIKEFNRTRFGVRRAATHGTSQPPNINGEEDESHIDEGQESQTQEFDVVIDDGDGEDEDPHEGSSRGTSDSNPYEAEELIDLDRMWKRLYSIQRYEGASTIYGPFTLEAYTDLYTKYAPYLADGATSSPPAGPTPEDLTKRAISLQTGVVFDAAPIGKKFGSVLTDVSTTTPYQRGQTVTAVFQGANPRNNLRLEGTYMTVDQLVGGTWQTVRTDSHPSTKLGWLRTNTALGYSTVTTNWTIESTTPAGSYRFTYNGNNKPLIGSIGSFTGTSSTFTLPA
ncbi:hypothetical protein FRC12_011115 [Ceratobasidium sp. 428]|nr:hypothetical protein FRC12_011115 [Ceratobasidium sp. 428]